MWAFPGAFSSTWNVTNPTGTKFSCAGTTTQCFQEAVTASFTNVGTAGSDLTVYGGDESTGGAAVINIPSTVTWPVYQGKKVRVGSVTFNWSGSPSSNPIFRFDSGLMVDWEMAGGQLVKAGEPAVVFKPTNLPPEDHAAGIVIVDSRYRATTWGSTLFDLSTSGSGVGATIFDIVELNAGTGVYGWKVPQLASGSNYAGNFVSIRHLHGSFPASSIIYQNGTGAPAGGQVMGQGIHILGITSDLNSNVDGIRTWGSNDFWLATINGVAGTSFRFEAGSCGNIAIVPYNSAWNNFADAGGCAIGLENIVLGNSIVRAATIQTVSNSAVMTCTATLQGARRFVTNATSATFHDFYASGGSFKVPVVCDGVDWRIGG